MNIFLKTITLVLSLNFGYAQIPIHLDTNQLMKGIYKDFDEFKYNKPSITHDFHIKERIFANTTNITHTSYSLVSTYNGSNMETIWGMCDGESIYAKSDEKTFITSERWFEKIHFLGRYSIYEKLIIGTKEGTEGGVYIQPNKVRGMFISLKTGRTFELDYNRVLDVLEKDTMMLNDFKKDRKNNRKLEFYIKLFAEKHKDDYRN
jgi:hypothetical protein